MIATPSPCPPPPFCQSMITYDQCTKTPQSCLSKQSTLFRPSTTTILGSGPYLLTLKVLIYIYKYNHSKNNAAQVSHNQRLVSKWPTQKNKKIESSAPMVGTGGWPPGLPNALPFLARCQAHSFAGDCPAPQRLPQDLARRDAG